MESNALAVELKILDPRWGTVWPLPQKATSGAAAIDLRAAIDAPLPIDRVAQLVPTGLAIHPLRQDVAALILPRSGLGHKQGLVLGNGTGLIDADYQGPLMVSLVSRSGDENPDTWIQPGDRIAQLVFVPVLAPHFRVVEEFSAATERGSGGFGHTGSQ